MSKKKTFYRYNPVTENYERVYPSRKEKMWAVARQTTIGAVIGAGLFMLAYYLVDFPRERELVAANEKLEAQFSTLNRRSDEALAVMRDLAARDNNFYRVVMQAEPLSDAARYAGLERQRNYEALDSMTDLSLVRTVSDKV